VISVHVDQRDLNKCLRDVRKWSEKKQNGVWNEMVDAANNTTREAVSKVPAKTRRLRNDINSVFNKAKLTTKSGTKVNYAPYVEFGTGTLVDVPEGLEDYAMQFKGQGIRQVNLPARPYLFPAFFKEQKELLKRLKTLFKR